MTDNQLVIDIIGDSGPFSQLGKSIGYRIKAGDSEFLLDCGAPVFQLLGADGLARLDGIIVTHCHEDHKRWFADIALFHYFASKAQNKLPLFCSEKVLSELKQTSTYALQQTLSKDKKKIVNLEFEDYFSTKTIGPQARYRCKLIESKAGQETWRVVDTDDNILPPDQAKVFKTGELRPPRMLFKDPVEQIWVEPESFYAFTDERFYLPGDYFPYAHPGGLKITPVKATAWHGPHTNSYLFEYRGEKIFFSSDTYYNPQLWQELTAPIENASQPPENIFQLDADINPYIEQTWSSERYERAISFYNSELLAIHDVTGPWANVHTNYKFLEERINNILLTHSPDEFTTLHPMAHLKKSFLIENKEIKEIAGNGKVYPLCGDCFQKQFSRFYVGFKDSAGDYLLIKKEPGLYDIIKKSEALPDGAQQMFTVALYQDIAGEYFPALSREDRTYIRRPDGLVELQTYSKQGTTGTIVSGHRQDLTEKD